MFYCKNLYTLKLVKKDPSTQSKCVVGDLLKKISWIIINE